MADCPSCEHPLPDDAAGCACEWRRPPPPPVLVMVGELNPYGSDEDYALFDEPKHSAGGRLRRLVLGVPRRIYFSRFARHNLCVGRWSAPAARDAAARLHEPYPEPLPFLLLGRKVAEAFGMSHVPPFTRSERYLVVPHPSGLCREWAKPDAVPRVRALLQESVPDIEWGALERASAEVG